MIQLFSNWQISLQLSILQLFFIPFLKAKVGKILFFFFFLSCILPYQLLLCFYGRDILVENLKIISLFHINNFKLLNTWVEESTELQLKDKTRLELCILENNLHQSQGRLRRLKEIPKLQSCSCEKRCLLCARSLTYYAVIIIAL